MAYCVTGMFARPDVGFKAEKRITAQGAKDLAAAFRAEGRLYVEVRNDRGELLDRERLDQEIKENSASEADMTRRLAPRSNHTDRDLTSRWRSTENSASPPGPAETGLFGSSPSAG